jgi:hypothetical protein
LLLLAPADQRRCLGNRLLLRGKARLLHLLQTDEDELLNAAALQSAPRLV